MKKFKFALYLLAVLCVIFSHGSGAAFLAFIVVAALLSAYRPAYLQAVTLSVPEILMDVLDAFKLETPELFGENGFATDFSSKTAVLGDKITAHIAHVPVTAAYNPVPGSGFYNGAQDVTTLLEDVPVTLNQFQHVPIKVGWLTQLSSKLPLYREAVRNYGYALGQYVVQTALGAIAGNFSNSITGTLANTSLDTLEGVRTQMNTQKVLDRGRWGLCSSAFAQQLQNDDRVKSSLFYGYLNGDRGYRVFRNIAGFSWIREYPAFPTSCGLPANLHFFGGDQRALTVATRRPDFSNVASELGIPQIMEFYPMEDEESGLFLTGVGWQEQGTGDVYTSAAVLFGVAGGNQGTGAGKIADNAGVQLILN